MPTTTVISNGSRWAGQPPADIAELLGVLAEHPLSAQYAPFIHVSEIGGGSTRFFGNFVTISHVFNIDTNDPKTIASLTEAIQTNQQRPDYRPLPEKAADDTEAEVALL